jgi:hypothetical protein
MIRYVQVKDAKGNPIDARVLIGPDVESLDRMEKTFATAPLIRAGLSIDADLNPHTCLYFEPGK